MSELINKVKQLKCSFSVENVPLIKSDRFSDDEIATMKKASKAHISHWYHLSATSKQWSDAEIEEQISTFINQSPHKETLFLDIARTLFLKSKFENYKEDYEIYKNSLYSLLNWKTPLLIKFWSTFGSAPYFISDSNKELLKSKKLYGACGMNDIFEDKFENNYWTIHGISNLLSSFKTEWEAEVAKRARKLNPNIVSAFISLDDIEENVTVKNIKNAAKIFYQDITRDFTERVKVFDTHGEQNTYIFNPSDYSLKKIFDVVIERNEYSRHEIVECSPIIQQWIDMLKHNRCEIDYSQNKYHPSILKTKRNYTPSKAALERLYKFYMEKLFLDEVGSFEFDW